MATRILPAVGDIEAARALSTLTGRLPDAGPVLPAGGCAAVPDAFVRSARAGAGGDSTVPPRDRTYTLDEDK
ncbi:hypothetical protein DMA15_23570 [Streptomyces sp. WAC 01529]|uniref:hypothetical protein n=1 Tax=Streptomyces sp. WAC 01529 TaxID=2203205 RepID=UPI000F7084A7|nr:hypothetical protein [Streptomyces sp. WAC 01529]AZM55182.1 hypothetical protein DMA15_23570 [Streptomyces sp. WAC 01529]